MVASVSALIAGVALLLLDQWSKRIVRAHLRGRSLDWPPILRIRCVGHSRPSYDRAAHRILLVALWFAALVSAVLLHHTGQWFESVLASSGLGLAFGGAVGNLVDIVRDRRVVDFIELSRWPAFNVADVGIVAGLMVALSA